MLRARSEAPRAQKQVSFQHCQPGAHLLLLDSTPSPAHFKHGRTDSQVAGGKGNSEGGSQEQSSYVKAWARDSRWPQGTQESLEILEYSWHVTRELWPLLDPWVQVCVCFLDLFFQKQENITPCKS